MTSLLSGMRTIRPQGPDLRITQPHGLRVSYLGGLPSLRNGPNRIFPRYDSVTALQCEAKICMQGGKQLTNFFNIPILFPTSIVLCLGCRNLMVGHRLCETEDMQWLITESRSNDFGWLGSSCGHLLHLDQTSFFRQRPRSVPICAAQKRTCPAQLRNNAVECIRLAEAARTSRQRSLFIEMAERWLTLAEHAAKTQAR
jgi:hypothetical protein